MQKSLNLSPELLKSEDLDYTYDILNRLLADKLRASFYEFFLEFWPVIETDELKTNWHIEYLCDRLQALFEKLEKGIPPGDMGVNVPPGSSKSRIFTIFFPAWVWTRRSSFRIISSSYSADLSTEHAVKSRDIITSPRYRELFKGEVVLKQDQNNKAFYENTVGGKRIATSTNGTATGRHADLLISDDPINPKMAQSEVERKNTNDHVEKTLYSRKTDKKMTPLIIVMQRLHEEDPIGRKLALGVPFEHICLPAEITELDNVKPAALRNKYKKGLLDPVRMDKEVLEMQRLVLGGTEYGGQFLQSPKDAEGNVFKREWFDFYDDLPAGKPIRITNSWDTAFKVKEENDFSCMTSWAEYETGHYLIGFFMAKLEYPELKQEIRLQHQKYKAHRTIIEDKASGQTALQELKRLNIPIQAVEPYNDKIMRANQSTPPFESGNVYFPYKEYVEKIIEQLTGFPNTKHDDIVDSITQYLNWAREKSGGLVFATSGKPTTKTLLRGY